jgi:hypothetical protein
MPARPRSRRHHRTCEAVTRKRPSTFNVSGRRRGSGLAPAVAWDTLLSDLRRALPQGTAIRVHDGGRVTLDVLGERPRVFGSADAALDWATAPGASRGLDT